MRQLSRASLLLLLTAACGGTPTTTGGDDLAGLDLFGADFAGADFAGADLAGQTTMDLATGCKANEKICSAACVTADETHGCASTSCTPCGGGTNATAACSSAGACALQCNVGFGDCDNNASNGCEKDVTTDASNCGSCGFACANGAPCVSGACQIVMPGTGSDQACLTIDATTIYWATANANPGAVYSVPKAGGAPTQLVAGLASPRGIAVDATSVYFTLLGGGSIMKCPLAGCGAGPTVLASAQVNPFGLAIDATNVYWTNRGGNTVMKCAKAGCNNAPTMLATGQMTPHEIAVDATSVYWTNAGSGTVMKVPLAGGAATVVATGASTSVHGIAVDATSVYFTQPTQGLVSRVLVGGGTPTSIATGQKNPWAIALDGAGLAVWSNSAAAANGGAIVRAPTTGGAAVTRAANQAFPLCVAADATTIYWIDAGGNSVQKVAK